MYTSASIFALLPALLAIFDSISHTAAQGQCGDMKKVDKCAQVLYLYGDKEYKFPKTIPEARASCRRNKEAEKCIREYASSCTKAFTRQYINIMLAGPLTVVKERCTRVGIRELLKNHECLDASKNAIDTCHLESIEDSVRITKARKDDWIPLTCCFLSKNSQCAIGAVERICKDDKDSLNYVSESVKLIQGDVYDLLCGNDKYLWGNEKCTRLARNLSAPDADVERPKSIIPVTFDMLEKYLRKD